jgi:protoporphyrinogen oxidase
MSDSLTHVVILGAGPAGLGAAYQLTARRIAKVTVLEQSDRVGGNAGSFEFEGLKLDYGSHRLHSSCDPRILGDIKSLIGEDLLLRPRHGRIRIQSTWIHYPLKPADLVFKMQPGFLSGAIRDAVLKLIKSPPKSVLGEDTFASVLQSQLGTTACEGFYFPYARKIWGLEPDKISGIQAKRRVSANSAGKIIKKLMSTLYKSKTNSKNYFYYPRAGYGQISEAICGAALDHGAEVKFGSKVKEIRLENNKVRSVVYENNAAEKTIDADYVWSTIPISVLVRSLRPMPPDEIMHAASRIRFRSMILIYLILDQDRFSEYDAHYFPESDIAVTRLSEPKNYSDTGKPAGLTALCAELPCDVSDDYWRMSNEDLGRIVLKSLETAKIPVTSKVRSVEVRRIVNAYPIYEIGYEKFFEAMDRYIEGIENLLTFGRQGLFAHDNTHHALYMAYSAADCLDQDGSFDERKWQDYRKIFESHVVED